MQNLPPPPATPKQFKLQNSKWSTSELPPIPDKLYFTIGEASKLCLVKPYVLRYWEREFPELNPMKRRGKRRYYQRAEILLIRRIRSLLYELGFTITGARAKLSSDDSTASSNVTPAQATDTSTTKLAKRVISQLQQVLAQLLS